MGAAQSHSEERMCFEREVLWTVSSTSGLCLAQNSGREACSVPSLCVLVSSAYKFRRGTVGLELDSVALKAECLD